MWKGNHKPVHVSETHASGIQNSSHFKRPAAPIEFPAWCRMTQNALLDMVHPYYLIEYKPQLKKE
jgi:hypothetical protein